MKFSANCSTRREPGTRVWAASITLLGIMTMLVAGCATNSDILPPRCVNSPIPDYPPEAILKRKSGELEVLLHLLEDGSVHEIKIHRSTGIPILDEAGMEYVKSLEFLPLVVKGRKQPCWVEQTVIFSLEKPPLNPVEWRRTTRRYIQKLEEANPAEQARIHQRLYSQCTDYMSYVITQQDLTINRMAIEMVVPSLREKWAQYTDTFPMSFLMFADYVVRIEDPPYHERALVQLKQSVEVDILLIEKQLRSRENTALLHLHENLRNFLSELQ